VSPGTEWDSAIAAQLVKSNIVLVLISADFIASDYCYEKELNMALEWHREGKMVLIPVFLRPCHHHHLPFSQIQGVPRDAVPIEKLQHPEDGYVQVAEAVQQALV